MAAMKDCTPMRAPPCHDALAVVLPEEKEEPKEAAEQKPPEEVAPTRSEYKYSTPIPIDFRRHDENLFHRARVSR